MPYKRHHRKQRTSAKLQLDGWEFVFPLEIPSSHQPSELSRSCFRHKNLLTRKIMINILVFPNLVFD